MSGGLLLDSHVFYWLFGSEATLGPKTLEMIARAAIVHVSAVTVAELSIKHARGRLPLPGSFAEGDFSEAIKGMGLVNLPLDASAASRLRTLPRHHGDPFDRLLIAQALDNDLTIVTHDHAFKAYEGLDILWT